MQETATSLISFGVRGEVPVAIKVVKEPGNEWRAGEIADAFAGAGVVQVYEYVDGASLMEWLRPGVPLSELLRTAGDERATEVLVEVIAAMSPRQAPRHVPAAAAWAVAFDRCLASDDGRISRALVLDAQRVYMELCRSQRETRLLHGDLHHENVLFDYGRGWLAIDPKGVIGEVAFEVGAALRNPIESPEVFTDPETLSRRVDQFANGLQLDRARILGWAFSQAVLAAIWLLEDEDPVASIGPWVAFAETTGSLARR